MEVVGLLHYKLEELVLEFMQQWPKIGKLKQVTLLTSASTPREPRSWQWRAPKVIKMMEQLKPFQSEFSSMSAYAPSCILAAQPTARLIKRKIKGVPKVTSPAS